MMGEEKAMTLEERIEKAARAHADYMFDVSFAKDEAQKILESAFPELFGPSPTHWLAPTEADEGMAKASGEFDFNRAKARFAAMRTDYLPRDRKDAK